MLTDCARHSHARGHPVGGGWLNHTEARREAALAMIDEAEDTEG
jgi:hypothetical protein